jgi:hypothetical protein
MRKGVTLCQISAIDDSSKMAKVGIDLLVVHEPYRKVQDQIPEPRSMPCS